MTVKEGPRASHAKQTRHALMRAARSFFARKGYAQTRVSEIVDTAGVTKGALYHHFADKEALFAAVVEELEQELVTSLERAADTAAGAGEKLEAVCREYLARFSEKDFRRVLVLDAPAVLGWKRWCQVVREYEARVVTRCIAEAKKAGVLASGEPEQLSQVVVGMLSTAARVATTTDECKEDDPPGWTSVNRLLDGLKDPGGAPP